jgi:hypothetical protein
MSERPKSSLNLLVKLTHLWAKPANQENKSEQRVQPSETDFDTTNYLDKNLGIHSGGYNSRITRGPFGIS